MATQNLLKGDPVASTRMFIELPEKVDQQAEWEFELALAALEAGLPADVAAEHFRIALELEPSLGARPVIAYYLEQLGRPVPPPRAADPITPTAPEPQPTAEPTPAADKPADPVPTPAPAPAPDRRDSGAHAQLDAGRTAETLRTTAPRRTDVKSRDRRPSGWRSRLRSFGPRSPADQAGPGAGAPG